jgi:hypothetical protein
MIMAFEIGPILNVIEKTWSDFSTVFYAVEIFYYTVLHEAKVRRKTNKGKPICTANAGRRYRYRGVSNEHSWVM